MSYINNHNENFPVLTDYSVIKNYLVNSKSLTPNEMLDLLTNYGYRGQLAAKRSICLMAYRHINRLKNIYLKNIPIEKLPPKQNLMFIGPTGVGKTYLIELLFGKILKLPFVITDTTQYSATGYMGKDVVSVLTRLIENARSKALSTIGIICFDEFDKLATNRSTAVFSGEGTTKDVNGLGVQRELLKMIESSKLEIPDSLNQYGRTNEKNFSTENLAFIACGAFSGMSVVSKKNKSPLGFKNVNQDLRQIQHNELVETSDFEKFGFLPELIGRFSNIVQLEHLDFYTLKEIFINSIYEKFSTELDLMQVELVISDAVVNKIVADAQRLKTGARGLNNSFHKCIDDAFFEIYSNTDKYTKLVVYLHQNETKWKLIN